MEPAEVQKLKNLKYLYIGDADMKFGSKFLRDLTKLQQIHMDDQRNVKTLFDQKTEYGRSDLKIYLGGLLLEGPEDEMVKFRSNADYMPKFIFVHLAANLSRLADLIQIGNAIDYAGVQEAASPESAFGLLERLVNLDQIVVSKPVENIECFLNILQNCHNLVELEFRCDQPPCSIDCLSIVLFNCWFFSAKCSILDLFLNLST